MSRAARAWAVFAAACAMALAVMAFLSIRVLEFEQSMAGAQARAALEERVRLALWRMDSAAALLLPRPALPPQLSNVNAPLEPQQQVQQQLDTDYQRQLSKQEYQQRVAQNVTSKAASAAGAFDWRTLEPALLEQVRDLFPICHLEPVPELTGDPAASDDPRRLASIPARLVVPESALPTATLPWNTPVRVSLMLAWACLLLAAGALGWMLAATLSLSERRGAFASAVTHELRTPLTTLRMYAELLADGKVPDTGKQREYLGTLAAESDRLARLVENVLAYSRLENRLSPGRAAPTTIARLIELAIPTLQRRVEQASLAMSVSIADDAASATVRVDPVAIQQILTNLVDNACKYAGTPIELAAARAGECVELSVADRGPGVGTARLFEAFCKAKNDPAAGIGLGLFLSRALARAMGGDLRHQSRAGSGGGTVFVLTIPVARGDEG